jgi:hypothetical protein
VTDVDFDLHGLAGVRVVGAGPADVAAVRAQLGPVERPLDRDPDILVRFVDELPGDGPLHLLGDREAGWDSNRFVVLRGKHKSRARVELPLDRFGQPCEIVCERGLTAVPLLIAAINMAVLANGALPLHASGFEHDGVGVVVTGWSKGGKTEALLGFLAMGARYVGDEWLYLTPDGSTMYGIPQPIRVWDWHLDDLPSTKRRLPPRSRAVLGALRSGSALAESASSSRLPSSVRRASRRVAHALDRQRHVDVEPERIAGALGILRSTFDVLVHVVASERDDTVVLPADPGDVADRMAASLEYERLPLTSAHLELRYAHPDRRNPRLATAGDQERALLHGVFAGKPAFRVEHPHPASPTDLAEALAPHIGRLG